MNKNIKVSWSMFASFLALALMTVTLSLNGCSTAGSSETKATNMPKAQMSNSDLEDKVKAKFKADTQLNPANLTVNANVDRNEITLTGTVETEALRTKAVELAKSVQAEMSVTTKIDVKPSEISRTAYTKERALAERNKAKAQGESVGESLDDAWIHTRIVAQLIGNSMTPERKINVDVKVNAVTLRGTVESAAQRMEAERVAKNTEGVKSVSNQLKVSEMSLKEKKT